MAEKKTKILLESGTNELEILEFIIAHRHFGINVSKVVEIMQCVDVTHMPNSNTYIHGVFKPRDKMMTLINLPLYLGLPESENPDRDIYIITNFNKNNFAFHVHSVEVIHRISWELIEKPDSAIYGGEDDLATGIASINDKLITIIDFEKIIADICPQTTIQISDIDKLGKRDINLKPVMVVEDSTMLKKILVDSLEKAGYQNLLCCSNGKEAWDKLISFKGAGNQITDFVKCVITDIEMPKMDGHKLTKNIKDDEVLNVIPVIIFSSLISDEMKIKGKEVGADAQITKPEIGSLVSVIDNFIL